MTDGKDAGQKRRRDSYLRTFTFQFVPDCLPVQEKSSRAGLRLHRETSFAAFPSPRSAARRPDGFPSTRQ